MINRLVVNGCSYLNHYSQGKGHVDLAQQLNIPFSHSLSQPGSSNNRIIRTTLKDSYTTDQPTLYIIGLSFLNRTELPIGKDTEFEGKWISFQNYINPEKISEYWTDLDSQQAIAQNLKIESYVIKDKFEDLMFKLLAMVADLTNRKHQVVIFRQPDDYYINYLDEERFKFLKNCVNIVHGLLWSGLDFQASNGVKYVPQDYHHPKNLRHPAPGEHYHLNKFLVEYVATHNLL